jgi:hypothetical protein
MNVRTTWVSPARAISGQDHLAVLAVSQHLFTELLPGITNVTRRVRLYAFTLSVTFCERNLSRS